MPYDYSHFNALDALLCVTLLFSIVVGFVRGMIRESLGLTAWAGAAWIAKSPPDAALQMVQPWIQDPIIQKGACMMGVFVIALTCFMLIVQWISSTLSHTMFHSVDRSLGGIFGSLRGLLLMSGIYVAGLSIRPWDKVPPIVTQSKSVRWLNKSLVLWEHILPPQLQNEILQNNLRVLTKPIVRIDPLAQPIFPQ